MDGTTCRGKLEKHKKDRNNIQIERNFENYKPVTVKSQENSITDC